MLFTKKAQPLSFLCPFASLREIFFRVSNRTSASSVGSLRIDTNDCLLFAFIRSLSDEARVLKCRLVLRVRSRIHSRLISCLGLPLRCSQRFSRVGSNKSWIFLSFMFSLVTATAPVSKYFGTVPPSSIVTAVAQPLYPIP